MDLDLSVLYLDTANKSHRWVGGGSKIKVHPQGSVTLGMLTTVLCVKDALGNGQDLKIGLPGIAVRITAPREGSDPHPRIEFSSEEYSNGSRSGRAANYWTDNAASRAALTTLVFNLPEVGAAVENYCRMLDEVVRSRSLVEPSASAGLNAETAALIDALAQR